jgi:hypothetical protein
VTSFSFTSESGSQAKLSFSGDAVAVYGGVNVDHGFYTVSLDGQTQQHNGGGYDEYHPQVSGVMGDSYTAGTDWSFG